MNIAIILTGGNGSRLSSKTPKQFIKINEKELFIYTLEVFYYHPKIDEIVLIINKEYIKEYKDILKKYNLTNRVHLVFGGNTRQESTFNALKYLKETNVASDDIIIVHDGARPLLVSKIIDNHLSLISKNKNPISTIINIVDTIVDKDYNLCDRDNLFCVQTPQSFLFNQLYKAHIYAKEKDIKNASDDIMLCKINGESIDFIQGDRINFKITTIGDLELLKKVIKR